MSSSDGDLHWRTTPDETFTSLTRNGALAAPIVWVGIVQITVLFFTETAFIHNWDKWNLLKHGVSTLPFFCGSIGAGFGAFLLIQGAGAILSLQLRYETKAYVLSQLCIALLSLGVLWAGLRAGYVIEGQTLTIHPANPSKQVETRPIQAATGLRIGCQTHGGRGRSFTPLYRVSWGTSDFDLGRSVTRENVAQWVDAVQALTPSASVTNDAPHATYRQDGSVTWNSGDEADYQDCNHYFLAVLDPGRAALFKRIVGAP